jgi:hypothetical protein
MTVIQHSLFSLFKRFPERMEEFRALLRNSESFKTLCEDYHRCTKARQYWERSLSENAPARMREYEALMHELEEEILQNMNEAI